MRAQSFLCAVLALLAARPDMAQAGGPFAVTGDGRPYRFDPTQPVPYVVDAGPFGTRSHTAAVTLTEQAFRRWEAVPTARLRFQAAGELPQDVDGRSVMAFLNGLKPGDASPVLFDSDGSIVEVFFGRGASNESRGFAYPWWGNPSSGQILASAAVVNGKLLSLYSDDHTLQWFVHELGHLVGLHHSQLGAEAFFDGDPTNDHLAPVMSYFWGPNSRGPLHREDEAWFSWLYPSPLFLSTTGSIRGRVQLPDRLTGLQGVTVVARRLDDPQVTAVSGVTGYLSGAVDDALRDPGRPGEAGWRLDRGDTPGGAPDPARLGEFLIPGLPPGSYTLELRPVEDVPSVPRHGYLVGGPKFWRDGSSAQDPRTSSTPIVVNAGQEVSGIDFIVNGEDLGQPRLRIEEEPNPWSSAQVVGSLPLEIVGGVADDRGGTSTLPRSEEELHDVYQVTLSEWTVVTAVLSAAEPGADLDLYLYALDGGLRLVAQATAQGTPPEVLQVRLAPGRYRVGVHHSGGSGSGYTLRLLAAPAPDPVETLEPPYINYLVIGQITESSAVMRWQATGETAAVIHYGQPVREVGSTERGREHTLSLSGLDPGSSVTTLVFTAPLGVVVQGPFTTAKPPAANGAPRIVTETNAGLAGIRPLGRDSSMATVYLSNTGVGDALDVRIEEVTPAPGWEVLSEALSGTRLPGTLDVGRIGAGGQGLFRVLLVRRSGTVDPGITVHGSYTDAAGTVQKF